MTDFAEELTQDTEVLYTTELHIYLDERDNRTQFDGLTYNDGFTNWNVNRSGRITGAAPILGIADFGGKSKASYIKSILPKGFKLAREFMSHNEKVYEYKGKYYSLDNTSHKGGVWKVMVKRGGRLHRIGTADVNLNIFAE